MKIFICINILISISAILHIFVTYFTFQCLKSDDFYETNKIMKSLIINHKFITILITILLFGIVYLINYIFYIIFIMEVYNIWTMILRICPFVLFLSANIYLFINDLIMFIAYIKEKKIE